MPTPAPDRPINPRVKRSLERAAALAKSASDAIGLAIYLAEDGARTTADVKIAESLKALEQAAALIRDGLYPHHADRPAAMILRTARSRAATARRRIRAITPRAGQALDSPGKRG